MDHYEYKVRVAQIKSLIENGEFYEAMTIANEIDWRRVRSVQTLCMVSEIYKINRQYDEARDVLLMAYSRHPGNRSVVRSLCELAIKQDDLTDAIAYLQEFIQLVGENDSDVYILRYKLFRSQGVGIDEKIDVLRKLKATDYQEQWAYELAFLYHEKGMYKECVDECNELIVWFGRGKYVNKAMELKMLYEELTPDQQRRYERRNAPEVADEIAEENTAENASAEGIPINIKRIEASNQPTKKIPNKEVEAELEQEEITVKPVNLDKYSTLNLQAELQRNIEELEAQTGETLKEPEQPILPPAWEQEMPAGSPVFPDTGMMEITPEMTENDGSAIQDMPPSPAVEDAPMPYIADKAAITADIKDKAAPTAGIRDKGAATKRSDYAYKFPDYGDDAPPDKRDKRFAKIISEEYDGQLSLNVPDSPEELERQITGQLNITDILNGWDRQKEEGDKLRIEKAKQLSRQQTGELINELAEFLPEIQPAPVLSKVPVPVVPPPAPVVLPKVMPAQEGSTPQEASTVQDNSTAQNNGMVQDSSTAQNNGMVQDSSTAQNSGTVPEEATVQENKAPNTAAPVKNKAARRATMEISHSEIGPDLVPRVQKLPEMRHENLEVTSDLSDILAQKLAAEAAEAAENADTASIPQQYSVSPDFLYSEDDYYPNEMAGETAENGYIEDAVTEPLMEDYQEDPEEELPPDAEEDDDLLPDEEPDEDEAEIPRRKKHRRKKFVVPEEKEVYGFSEDE